MEVGRGNPRRQPRERRGLHGIGLCGNRPRRVASGARAGVHKTCNFEERFSSRSSHNPALPEGPWARAAAWSASSDAS